VIGAASDRGALAVLVRDDLVVRPDQLDGLRPLDDPEKAQFGLKDTQAKLAYGYEARPYAATIAVERVTPWITAQTYDFLRLDPGRLSAHYEVNYDVRRARVSKLALLLPESTPGSLSIHGLDGVTVKEYTSEVVDGQRRWTALLAERRRGRIRLAVEFQQRLKDQEPKDLLLPLVRAADVEYQSAIVAVEGNAEYHVDIRTEARNVDVGELVDADYQTGKRLLGAYRLGNAGGDVRIDITRRPGYGLPSAIVQRAELVTLVSTSGKSQTAARFLLRSKASYLEVTLPKDPPAILWSAVVDGKPSTPQREGDRHLLSLPPNTGEPLRDVQLVYETAVAPIRWMGDVAMEAPQLALRDETGEQTFEVPVADVQWHLVLPSGHRMIRSSGTVFTSDIPSRTSPIFMAGAVLFEMAGGIRPTIFLASRDVATAGRAVTSEAAPQSAATPALGIDFDRAENEEAVALDADVEMAAEEAESAGVELMGQQDGAVMGKKLGEEIESPRALVEKLAAQAPADKPVLSVESVAFSPDGKILAGRKVEKYWALEGVRSLRIDLVKAGDQVTFQSMGIRPRLQATLVNERGLNCLAWSLALLVGLLGVIMTNHPVRRKARFVTETLLIALLLPLVIGWLLNLEVSETFEPAFYAACLLVPYYLLVGAVRWCYASVRHIVRWFGRRTATATAATSAVLLLATMVQAQTPPVPVDDLLDLLDAAPPIELPADAVIIPYDPNDENGVQNAAKVLIPYQDYESLWNRAYPDKPLGTRAAPAPYALAGASYQATLVGEEFLDIRGSLTIQTWVDETVEIPLPLDGGVLTRVLLDGQPAQIRVVQSGPDSKPRPAQPVQQQVKQNAQPQPHQAPMPEPTTSMVVLHVSGKGRKQLELAARMRLDRSGGWRIARGRLPVAPATQLSLAVPKAHTEVRLSRIPDRGTYETQQDHETLETALAATGRFAIQWRPKVAVGQVDRSLTARSIALLDVQEDGLRLIWQLDLEFPRSQRDSFTFSVPGDYLVEDVSGDNVRGWQVQQENTEQRVSVTFLKETIGKESFTVRLARYGSVGQSDASRFHAPVVLVPEAILHQGELVIRRSPRLDVRVVEVKGMTRSSTPDETLKVLQEAMSEESPLGIRPFASYRFAATPYHLALSASAYRENQSAEVRALLKIGERESVYEARVQLIAQDRPVHRVRLYLPDSLKLDQVDCLGGFDWAETKEEGRRLLTVYLAEGRQGEFF
ncbi:MAG: hypothetical protein ACC645_16800, partial [Pirellulales bacterium]